MLAQSSIPLEGAPWPVRAVVVGFPAVLGAIATLVVALRGKKGRESEEHSPTSPPAAGPDSADRPVSPPATVEGKLDAAKELVSELRAQRDETKGELKEIATRHARELDALRRRHDREIGEMQAKLRSQDLYIERLERTLGLGPAGPTDPFPRQQQ